MLFHNSDIPVCGKGKQTILYSVKYNYGKCLKGDLKEI